jgi:hypothetical protein
MLPVSAALFLGGALLLAAPATGPATLASSSGNHEGGPAWGPPSVLLQPHQRNQQDDQQQGRQLRRDAKLSAQCEPPFVRGGICPRRYAPTDGVAKL